LHQKTDLTTSMNPHRLLFACLAIMLSFAVRSVLSQEAVEPRPDQVKEEPIVETTPAAMESPAEERKSKTTTEEATEEKPSRTATEETAEEEPARRTKKKTTDEQSSRVLQDAMTAKEFKAAGLEKLSAEELEKLNAWLQGYRQTAETKATEKATAETTKKVQAARHKVDRVESHVDGTMPHLTGHSVIKLEDGTVWKQANPDDRYPSPPLDHPAAVATRGAFGWKMRVAGLPEFYVNLIQQ
jgi:hypothetical protein